LDYGSGSGIFTNFLKENGFKDVVGYDPYSTPERPSRSFDIITCFEVIEHTPNPKQTLQDMLSFAKPETAIIFSTMLQPDTIGVERANLWYIAPRNGHISIFN
jgi:2-polyprenyl-6-hydroxyphenyl methylase/3-demethylubiquinone-9 3-methyltransferase